ncbi:hypothetical protein Tco_0791273 [Tanacetum coccineum]
MSNEASGKLSVEISYAGKKKELLVAESILHVDICEVTHLVLLAETKESKQVVLDRGLSQEWMYDPFCSSVKLERYSSSAPEGFDLMLWGDLHTLFEPDEEDEIWKDQHEYNLLSWRLCDFCGIHILLMNNGLAIHMLTEKKYPLSQEMLSKMLSTRLEVDHESSQAFELLRFIRAQVQK